MKKFLLVAAGMIFLLEMSQVISAEPSATLYTLSDIYYYVVDGTTATEGGHTLEPPSGATPGDTQFKTLIEVYEDIEASFNQCTATTPADVKTGKVFFCTDPDTWGAQTGTF